MDHQSAAKQTTGMLNKSVKADMDEQQRSLDDIRPVAVSTQQGAKDSVALIKR